MRRALRIAALGALLLAPATAWGQASPSPYTSATRYDAAGRVTGTISADPDTVGSGNPFLAVRNSYDAAGRLIKVETGTLTTWQSEAVAPASWTGFTVLRSQETQYDVMSRKTREILREGAAGTIRTVAQYHYDAEGRLDCTAVRMNPADFAAPPASACTQGTGGNDRITRTVYDDADRRIQLREGVGTGIEAAEATWAYDLSDRIVTVIDGNGNRAGLVYDGHGRQNCWMFPSTTRASAFNDATQATALATAGALSGGFTSGHCTSGNYETYSYDPNGNRTRLRKRDGRNIAFAYDNLNRVTAKTYPDGGATAVFYGYDLRNLQLYARHASASGEGITNVYDGFGRLWIGTNDTGGTSRELRYGYDRNGNRTVLQHPDGSYFQTWHDGLNRPYYLWYNGGPGIAYLNYTAFGAPGVMAHGAQTTWSYDNVQRETGRIHALNGTPGSVTWTQGYNPAGQIAGTTRDNDAFAWTGHYAVQRAYTTNGRNQYSAAGGASFTYDDNGNLTSEPAPAQAGGTKTYSYDIENRLVGVSGGVTLAYDPLGRLYQVATPTTDTRFLYDGDALVLEYNAAGNVLRRHAFWPGADVPMATFEGAGFADHRMLYADRQGSIIASGDENSMAVQVNSYDEYGIPGAANTGRFQYTGQIWLPEIGMYHYKARVYSPTLGRFLQTDPIGYDDQVNLYAYVGNDPVNFIDPEGKCGSIRDEETRSDCYRARSEQIQATKEYLRGQSVRIGSDEAAYIATYNEDTREVTVRTGDDAGVRTGNEVNFTDNEGNQLVARSGTGRIVERQEDGSFQPTRETLLVTGHGHTRDTGGGAMNVLDGANERIGSNEFDRRLSSVAPAVVKTPSGAIRVFVNGREQNDRQRDRRDRR